MIPSAAQFADQVPHLTGALRVQPIGRLVQDQQVAGHQQRVGDAEPLPHPEGVGTVALGGRGQQAHPVQCGVDAAGGRGRVAVPVGRVQPRQVGPAGEVRVEGRSLDQGADPAQDGVAAGPAAAGRAARSTLRWARSGRAASGWSWSCPTRWDRGSRRPPRRGTDRSTWSTAVCEPKRLVSPWVATTASSLTSPGPGTAAPGSTAPTAIRPSSVSTAENAVPLSSRPEPQVPETVGSWSRTPCSSSPAGAGPPAISETATVVQPLPTVVTPSGVSRASSRSPGRLPSGRVFSVTSDPGGGVNSKVESAGRVKLTVV